MARQRNLQSAILALLLTVTLLLLHSSHHQHSNVDEFTDVSKLLLRSGAARVGAINGDTLNPMGVGATDQHPAATHGDGERSKRANSKGSAPGSDGDNDNEDNANLDVSSLDSDVSFLDLSSLDLAEGDEGRNAVELLLDHSSLSEAKVAAYRAQLLSKGEIMICYMTAPEHRETESEFTNIGQLEKNGWKRENWVDQYRDEFKAMLKELGISSDAYAGVTLAIQLVIRYVPKIFELYVAANSSKAEGTGAMYWNTYNAPARTILGYNNYSPFVLQTAAKTTKRLKPFANGPTLTEQQLHAPIPALNHWSDVAFLEWTYQADEHNVNVNELKYIIRYHESGTDAWSQVIHQEFQLAGLEIGNHTPLSLDSDAAKVILGSEVGAGVAWFLFTHKHKDKLGLKTVKSIRTFRADGSETHHGSHETLAIAFEIGNVEE